MVDIQTIQVWAIVILGVAGIVAFGVCMYAMAWPIPPLCGAKNECIRKKGHRGRHRGAEGSLLFGYRSYRFE